MAVFSRREFLKASGGAAGGSWLAAQLPLLLAVGQVACTARDEAAAFKHLSADEARELGAIAEAIIPATDTPGATDIGVIYFIDEALGGFMAGARGFLQQGLGEFLSANGGEFARLDADQQITALTRIEQQPFFQLLRMLTLNGMFCMPGRGGNRDHQGWKLLGFEHQHSWQPPFGYYDAKEGNQHG